MRNSILILVICMMIGCVTTKVPDSKWRKSIGTDLQAGQIEYLDLNGLDLEWSTAAKGKGWLYFSKPGTNDKVWSFPSRLPNGEHETGIKVYDGDVVTAVHRLGRKFEIKIIIQTEYYIKVIYREI